MGHVRSVNIAVQFGVLADLVPPWDRSGVRRRPGAVAVHVAGGQGDGGAVGGVLAPLDHPALLVQDGAHVGTPVLAVVAAFFTDVVRGRGPRRVAVSIASEHLINIPAYRPAGTQVTP